MILQAAMLCYSWRSELLPERDVPFPSVGHPVPRTVLGPHTHRPASATRVPVRLCLRLPCSCPSQLVFLNFFQSAVVHQSHTRLALWPLLRRLCRQAWW